MSYSDIGFLSAGQKFAAEEFSKNNIEEEKKVIGFTIAILLVLLIPFFITMMFFSIYPAFIIKDFDLIDYFVSSEVKIEKLNFNFLGPTDYDEEKDF